MTAAAVSTSPVTLCAGDLPLVLLPVRLETRFFALPGNVVELRVRVYPDKIHLDAHEPDLLPTEAEWGAHYWEQDWRAGNDDTARAAAWRQLADRFGAARAAWIARQLSPTNPRARPTTPVPQDRPLPVAPVLATAPVVSDSHGSAWRHAPQARLMPDRWIALLRAGSATVQVVGRDIVRQLAVGPDPNRPKPANDTLPPDDQLAIDPGMKWMVDFDEAEAKGMALRITVPATPTPAGGPSLLVFGVSTSLTGTDAAAKLADLFDAHHYTDGLAFLPHGTPTNNTADSSAATTADDPAHRRSYAIEVASDPAALDALSNAGRVGTAFGLPADAIARVLGRIGAAGEHHELDMRSMNVALWQVGWSYYLTNMVGFDGTGLTTTGVAWARDHFASYVRSGGPFPILRCGRQPYGVLPVTSLDQWKPPAGQELAFASDVWLQGMLTRLRDNLWRARLGEALRLGRRTSPPDPDADLADVMRVDAVSTSYRTRNVFGRHYLQHLRAFLGEDLQGDFMTTQDALAVSVLQRLGIAAGPPRLSRVVAAEATWPVTAPLVQAGEVSPFRNLEPNYITALLDETHIDNLINLSETDQPSLLQSLLRHALLREIAHATAQIAGSAAGEDVRALLREAELVDLVTGAAPTRTWKRQLDVTVTAITGNATIRQFLEKATTFDAPSVISLGDFRRSLGHLQGLDSERLQLLMQGTLDLSSHRLDAWITSFATKRLAAMRAAAPGGAYVGGYAWVENLRPVAPSSVAPVTLLPAGESGPLVARVSDSGFLHAPSLTHAAAAALLRNAHLGASGTPQPNSPFATNLSSRRAREAERLLDGVRQGQPLGALLGYRLERSLHDLALDRYIATLRSLAPLVTSPPAAGDAPAQAIAANNVVDGQALFRVWRDQPTAVTSALVKAGASAAGDLSKVTAEIDMLGDAIDALSDALTAEAAYQIARGNTTRVASTLSAIARGEAPPPELEVARTPRSGTAVTHRLIVLFSQVANLNTPGWVSGARASAEPLLNFWVAKLLGDASKVRCTIEQVDPATGAVSATHTLPLSELAIAPLDVVFGVEAAAAASSPVSTLSEIEQLVLYQAKHRTGGFDVQANLRLQHARPRDLAPGELTLFDVLEQARAVQRLLASARGADPEDLNPPERTGSGSMDLAELEGRVVRAENGLNAAHKQLAALVTKSTTTTAETFRTAIWKLRGFGASSAVPAVALGEGPAVVAALVTQANALMKTSTTRLDQGAALRALPVVADPRARRDQLVERMRAVFGSSFVVLPRFTCGSTGNTELASAVTASKAVQGGDALGANLWFARAARVRDPVARLGACLRGAEVLGTGERLNLSVAQLPFVAGERWVGLPPDAGKAVLPGKLSIVLQTVGALNTAAPWTGLAVDEWTEIIPNARETTAVTFQFVPPDACAPQSVLIAVPPVLGVAWTSDTLAKVLDETLALAKLRTMDPELLGELAQYLPGLYLAFNAKNDAVSTDFAALTR